MPREVKVHDGKNYSIKCNCKTCNGKGWLTYHPVGCQRQVAMCGCARKIEKEGQE